MPDQAITAHTCHHTPEVPTMTHPTIHHTTDQATTAPTVDIQTHTCQHTYHQPSPTPPQYLLSCMTPQPDPQLTTIASTMTDIMILPDITILLTTDQDIMITDIPIDPHTTHHTDHTTTEICESHNK